MVSSSTTGTRPPLRPDRPVRRDRPRRAGAARTSRCRGAAEVGVEQHVVPVGGHRPGQPGIGERYRDFPPPATPPPAPRDRRSAGRPPVRPPTSAATVWGQSAVARCGGDDAAAGEQVQRLRSGGTCGRLRRPRGARRPAPASGTGRPEPREPVVGGHHAAHGSAPQQPAPAARARRGPPKRRQHGDATPRPEPPLDLEPGPSSITANWVPGCRSAASSADYAGSGTRWPGGRAWLSTEATRIRGRAAPRPPIRRPDPGDDLPSVLGEHLPGRVTAAGGGCGRSAGRRGAAPAPRCARSPGTATGAPARRRR